MLEENKKSVFFSRVPGCASGSGLGLSSCCCAASDLSTSHRLADLVPHSCRGNLSVVAPHATSAQLSQLLVPTVCRFPTFPCRPPTPSPARSRLIPCRWLVTTFIPFKLTQAFVFLRAPPVDKKKKKTLFRSDKLDCSQLFPSYRSSTVVGLWNQKQFSLKLSLQMLDVYLVLFSVERATHARRRAASKL